MEKFVDNENTNIPIPLITSLMLAETGRVNFKGNKDHLIFEKPGMLVVCKVYLTQRQV